jgi:hypothetical protein
MFMNIYESRYNNAKKVMNKINDLLSQGYRIMDEENLIVEKVIEKNDYSISYIIKDEPNTFYNLFINDVDSDDGMHTNIKEFNKRFENWTYFRPEHLRKLKL